MIVYAITSHDIYTNDMLMVQQLNNNKHTAGLNADLLKVKIFEDFFPEEELLKSSARPLLA